MKRLFFTLVAFSLLVNHVFSQHKNISLKFTAAYGDKFLIPGKNYFSSIAKDSINIETLRFYVADITFYKSGKKVYAQTAHFYLMDIEKKMQLNIPTQISSYDEIRFTIGVDSLTNVSGAMGGDLDPVNGMYWAWQSGYINFKLEGKSNACNTRNHVFQFHIGGYLPPNQTVQSVSLQVKPQNPIEIKVDIEKFLNGIDLNTTNEIMSPSEKAVTLAKLYQTIFSVKE